MGSVRPGLLAVAGLTFSGIVTGASSLAAVANGPVQALAEAPPATLAAVATDLELRFIQEDGPESGHVRVVLTPETRALTVFEARSAAEQGFLEALNEKGLCDNLSRITVVVRLVPENHPDPGGTEQVFRFVHKGGQDWTVLLGE